MKRKPWDFTKSINAKEYIDDMNGFSAFMTHKIFSADKNFIFLTNAINKKDIHKLPAKAIYDFYYETIPQNKKWLKYPKSEKELKEIQYIMRYFGVTEITAKDYVELISKEEMKEIVDYFERQQRGVRK